MNVLVATKERAVFDVLDKNADAECISALSTGKIYAEIPTTDLAIVDYEDLIAHPFSVGLVRKLLGEASSRVCTSAEFLASPDAQLNARRSRQRAVEFPPKRTIAFTSYSGGTGKTSLALDTAVHFARQTRELLQLPTALIEFTYGRSALEALLELDGQPALYDLVSSPGLEPYEFSGVTLCPMDYDQVRLLSLDRIARYLRQQVADHILTVIDTIWPHGLVSAINGQVDLWIVVATPRVDAVDNARRLRTELSRDFGDEKVIIAVNQMGGLGNSLALLGTRREIELPRVQQSDILFEGRLGKEVLSYLYGSLWKDYVRASKRRWRLFGSRA